MKNSAILLSILIALLIIGDLQAQSTTPAEGLEKNHHRHGHWDHEKNGHKMKNRLFHKHHHAHRGDHNKSHGDHRHHGKKEQGSADKPENK